MTSGNFASYPISDIIVLREERQRRQLTSIDELAESISKIGLIHPITITREGTLVAGERRLTACKSLGWTSISVQFAEDLSIEELRILELEENVKRVDLTWQEQAAALSAYHDARKAVDPEWTQADTAREVSLNEGAISKALKVSTMLSDPLVAAAKTRVAALNIVARKEERKKLDELAEIVEEDAPSDILNVDFTHWAEAYSGPKFNFIHCDFPYGVNLHKSGQAPGLDTGNYTDSPDVYFRLLDFLIDNLDNFCASSAHLVFWYSMKYHTDTVKKLSQAFVVNPLPLVWVKSDNAGILPDHSRGPRQIYETALFAYRGDRKIVRAVSNAISSPTTREIHMSEKPLPVLGHFFRMIVDDTTSILDPTCGSGGALRAAHSLGARAILGLEREYEFAQKANAALRAHKNQAQLEISL